MSISPYIHKHLRIETPTDTTASPCSENFAKHELWRRAMKEHRIIEEI